MVDDTASRPDVLPLRDTPGTPPDPAPDRYAALAAWTVAHADLARRRARRDAAAAAFDAGLDAGVVLPFLQLLDQQLAAATEACDAAERVARLAADRLAICQAPPAATG